MEVESLKDWKKVNVALPEGCFPWQTVSFAPETEFSSSELGGQEVAPFGICRWQVLNLLEGGGELDRRFSTGFCLTFFHHD